MAETDGDHTVGSPSAKGQKKRKENVITESKEFAQMNFEIALQLQQQCPGFVLNLEDATIA